MWATPILDVLCERRCWFVVVGSVARSLTGDVVTPNDLDIVVDPAPAARCRLVDALVDLRAAVECRRGRQLITHNIALPWEWGWTTTTAFGAIDVVTQFIDGTTFDDHEAEASTVTLPTGHLVRCHPTWRVQ